MSEDTANIAPDATNEVNQPENQDNTGNDFESLSPRTQQEIRALRAGEATYRTKLREAEQESGTLKSTLDSIMKALNPGADEDPAELARALKEKDNQIRQGSIELSVYRSASKLGADPDALLDSSSFMREALKLDSKSDTFGADLESVVKASLEGNSRLAGKKKAPAAKASGADISGGTGGGKTYTRAQIKSMTPEEYRANADDIRKAVAEGRLK